LCNDDNVDNKDDVDNKVKIEDKDLEELLHFGSLICGEEVVDIRSVNESDRKRILNRC
jgi:Holliday junction resolvase